VIASVHIADVGARSALAALRKVPRPAAVPGLRYSNVALAAKLSRSVIPSPTVGRVALVGFWDHDDALDRFVADHPTAVMLAEGWQVRLEPLRAFGSWPGLAGDIATARSIDHDGPIAVVTLGRLRLTQAVRFIRTSARAEGEVVDAPGLTWATGLARPPFVATFSLWETTRSLSEYAYGRSGAHPAAIAAHRAKPFHHESAFIRFRPYGSLGHLDGKNPLAETWMSSA
jgi:hypothetical protein